MKVYSIFSCIILTLTFSQVGQADQLNNIDAQWVTAPDVVEFQPYAKTYETELQGGKYTTSIRWTNLNENIDAWYLMQVKYGRKQNVVFNIENNFPQVQEINLMSNGSLNIVKRSNGEVLLNCNILGESVTDGEAFEAKGEDPYMNLCEGLISLRNHQNGQKSTLSWGTTFLRNTLGDTGDKIVNAVKAEMYDNAFYEEGTEVTASGSLSSVGGPADAKVKGNEAISNIKIKIQAEEDVSGGMVVGHWYKAKNFDGAYISVMKPKFVTDEIQATFKDRVNPIDSAGGGAQSRAVGEGNSIVVSMAIDLKQHTLSWYNGTEHPGVGWSSRANVTHQNAAGPDGFGNLSPLEFPGVINPVDLEKVMGTFAGGFQRRHSAFKWGPFTSYNRGHHYGFMEDGVLMSTLVPNLATMIIYNNGEIGMKTWQPSDMNDLSKMKDVRQNGVPLIDNYEPGLYVKEWGAGNWSGSAEAKLLTPRTSACLYEEEDKRYLIVSYFSAHTPSSMARVLQSFNCKYAIHLDMNHPKFAYAALFNQNESGGFDIEHLHESMNNEDVKANGVEAPRSILTPTYKDFFTISRKR